MDEKKILESIYKQTRNSPERPSTVILGLNKEGEFVEHTVKLQIHKDIYIHLKDLAETAGMPVEDFLIDCTAHGYIELGMIFDSIKIEEAGEYEEMRKEGNMIEH
ncbi:MAG: hypothetical protein WCQ99_01175 [Pseudomonadota bacterium]